jgi:hypothetical protein
MIVFSRFDNFNMLFVCNIFFFQEMTDFLGCYLFSNSFNYNFSCRDLSFNKLSGEMPKTFVDLRRTSFMYAF